MKYRTKTIITAQHCPPDGLGWVLLVLLGVALGGALAGVGR